MGKYRGRKRVRATQKVVLSLRVSQKAKLLFKILYEEERKNNPELTCDEFLLNLLSHRYPKHYF